MICNEKLVDQKYATLFLSWMTFSNIFYFTKLFQLPRTHLFLNLIYETNSGLNGAVCTSRRCCQNNHHRFFASKQQTIRDLIATCHGAKVKKKKRTPKSRQDWRIIYFLPIAVTTVYGTYTGIRARERKKNINKMYVCMSMQMHTKLVKQQWGKNLQFIS